VQTSPAIRQRGPLGPGPRELDRLRAESQNPRQPMQPGRITAPLSPRSALLLASDNYAGHLAEAGLHPKEPVFFAKLHSAVIGPGQAIRIPSPETHTDWEAELSIIIGKPAYQVPAEQAHEYIFSYTMINDVKTVRRPDKRALAINRHRRP
jgi:2-keto-4-pentenoate hydratase/2-oxohepta-3-ene-1,7-dioic acid hydratase in catechol pathway